MLSGNIDECGEKTRSPKKMWMNLSLSFLSLFFFLKGRLSKIYTSESNPIKTGCKKSKVCMLLSFYVVVASLHAACMFGMLPFQIEIVQRYTSDPLSSLRGLPRETPANSISPSPRDPGAFRCEKKKSLMKPSFINIGTHWEPHDAENWQQEKRMLTSFPRIKVGFFFYGCEFLFSIIREEFNEH